MQMVCSHATYVGRPSNKPGKGFRFDDDVSDAPKRWWPLRSGRVGSSLKVPSASNGLNRVDTQWFGKANGNLTSVASSDGANPPLVMIVGCSLAMLKQTKHRVLLDFET